MLRRKFSKYLAIGAGGLTLSPGNLISRQKTSLSRPILKPPALQQGDRIGLIAPSSSFDEQRYENALKNIREAGFKVEEGRHLHQQKGYLAGPDRGRLEDIHRMFDSRRVKGIWCLRGGYGSTRLLEKIDYRLIAANPKVFIGYSDITALLNAFWVKSGLSGFHGPVAGSELPEYSRSNLLPLVTGQEKYPLEFLHSEENKEKGDENSEFRFHTIRSGNCIGRLSGGNLSLLASLAGTSYLDSFKDKIVFIEDIGEVPYRIDRMLTQLLQATDLKKAAGIALGICLRCEKKEDSNSLSLKETLSDRLGNLGIPVAYGLSFGHIREQFTLPMGVYAQFNSDTGILSILESPVT